MYSPLGRHLDRDSFGQLQSGRSNIFLFVMVEGIQSFGPVDQNGGEQGQVYQPS